MAKMRSGVLGNTRGKIAGVVGSQWKDRNYLREYVKPANPRTSKQVEQRNALSLGVKIAKPIIGPILNEFVSPFEKGMSGFNRFLKENMSTFKEGTPSFDDMVLAWGNRWPAQVTSASLDGTPEVTIDFSTDVGTNGADDDKVIGLVFDDDRKRWFFGSAAVERQDGSVAVPVDGDLSEAYVSYFTICYVEDPRSKEEISASSSGHI